MAEQITNEDWGNIEELTFSALPEIDPNRPKTEAELEAEKEDPESPEMAWSKKVSESYVADHPESSEQLPN